jgi:hypothetical protein
MTRRAALLGVLAVPFAHAALPTVRPRSDWKAAPARPGGRPHTLARLALHHTAGPQVGSDKAPATLRGIQAFHQKDKGWIDLAYHLFVDADGVAWEGRDTAFAGDTATTYDPAGFLLICALGNFEEVLPTSAQLDGIARLMRAAHDGLGLSLDTVAIHRELAATLCPGKNLASRLPELVERARR